mgnify:CR=1 FL=1
MRPGAVGGEEVADQGRRAVGARKADRLGLAGRRRESRGPEQDAEQRERRGPGPHRGAQGAVYAVFTVV